jgi:alkylhydroperoxidase/carboxymuconolactone decarboxylase family protein YurZ
MEVVIMMHVSNSFEAFMKESGSVGPAFMEMVMKTSEGSALDKKTSELAYIAVLAAIRLQGGLPFHVKSAKALGATREEIISTILVGLPAVGLAVTEALPIALQSYDEE